MRKPLARFRHVLPLRLEQLEDRSVPAPISVTTDADDGAGSLRAAIQQANQDAASDTIRFDIANGPASIALKTALPAIKHPIILDAAFTPQARPQHLSRQLCVDVQLFERVE